MKLQNHSLLVIITQLCKIYGDCNKCRVGVSLCLGKLITGRLIVFTSFNFLDWLNVLSLELFLICVCVCIGLLCSSCVFTSLSSNIKCDWVQCFETQVGLGHFSVFYIL